MNYEERINELLKENLSEQAFTLWYLMNKEFGDIWKKPTSSTGKYHQKEDGRVPNVAEHTFEMLFAASKIIDLFGYSHKSKETDSVYLSIALHDCLKYGENCDRQHTANDHDRLVGNMILTNKKVFLKFLSEENFKTLQEACRYHTGRWSTDANASFDFNNMKKETLFIHTLDMLSSKNVLKI